MAAFFRLTTPSSFSRLRPSSLQQQLQGARHFSSQPSPLRHHAFRNAFHSSKRSQSSSSYAQPLSQRERYIKYATSGAIIGGTLVGTHLFLNRETRDSLTPGEREHLHSTFTYVGAGLGVVAVTAVGLHRAGWSVRIMRANPWLVIGGSLVGSIGCMMGVYNTSPSNKAGKHLSWLGFNAFQALTLSPLLFLQPALLGRAALYTAGILGSLSYVGATAKSDTYIWLGGPLLAGVTVVALSSLAPLVLPATATVALAASQGIWLYGGLAVFGGFVLWDTQKIIAHGKKAEQSGGTIVADPVADAIGLELDFINIFVRMIYILGMGNNRRK
ncbi:hypothetical protein BT69DRAFT_1313205 [Atractiella rhizophila]|nr:hypothetical protein BT69DRAFT_1313205 [Atractiella rhizophila]